MALTKQQLEQQISLLVVKRDSLFASIQTYVNKDASQQLTKLHREIGQICGDIALLYELLDSSA